MSTHESHEGKFDLLTVHDVQAALGLSMATVYRLFRSGSLPTVRIGGRVLVRRADLEEFVEARVERPGRQEAAAASS